MVKAGEEKVLSIAERLLEKTKRKQVSQIMKEIQDGKNVMKKAQGNWEPAPRS